MRYQHQQGQAKARFGQLSLTQKIVSVLSLIFFTIIGLVIGGVVLSIALGILVVGFILFGIRWLWCKVTGKPFIPKMNVKFQQFGQNPFQNTSQSQSNHDGETIEGEYERVKPDRDSINNSKD